MDEVRRWTRVVVLVDATQVELAADVLWGFEPAAIEEKAQPRGTQLLAGYADEAVARRAADAMTERGLGRPQVIPVRDGGLDAWRAWARPIAVGPFLITPSWLATDDPRPSSEPLTPLLVDPDHTFGSGSHPTTRLVLVRLAELVRPDDRVLDVGCGSGILAVGAALMGAGEVHGIDIDPGSPEATAANARSNGVADRVSASNDPLAEVAQDTPRGGYHLVLANLLAPVVVDLATDLAAAVAAGGHLVVSGLLVDRWEPAVAAVLAAAAPAGSLEVSSVDDEDGWVAVTLVRSA